MKFCYYIYYRVDGARTAELETAIHRMQQELKEGTGIAGRLLKKHEEPLLWMEIYENVPDAEAFGQALADRVEKYKLKRFLQPGTARMVECFVSE